MEEILVKNIIPFWYPEAIDFEEGGYRLNHDLQGKWRGQVNKSLVAQARTLWFYSRLTNSKYGTQNYLEAAKHGYDFLRDWMWDKRHGGFYWEVDPSGKIPTKSAKHLYGQAFALYALSEFAMASNDFMPKKICHELFYLIEEKAHDVLYGGYLEYFQCDWTPAVDSAKTYLDSSGSMKLMNTHLHLMEAITNYYQLTRSKLAQKRLIELILVLCSAVRCDTICACTEKFERDWTPIDKLAKVSISYGHILENIGLLINACRTAELSNGPLLNFYINLFQYAIRFGQNKKTGAFYDRQAYNKMTKRKEMIWWVQAEALISALRMFHLTKRDVYFQFFSRILEWITKYQVDWKNGEWHAKVDKKGRPSGDKAGAWKTPYHNGGAILGCLHLMKHMAES